MAFYLKNPLEVQKILAALKKSDFEKLQKKRDIENLIFFEPSDFKLFNPNTITCPTFRTQLDASITKKIYKNCPILVKKDPDGGEILKNPWELSFQRMFDMSNDSSDFVTKFALENEYQAKRKENCYYYCNAEYKFYPLYEGRMVWHYNHRYNSMKFAKKGGKMKGKGISPDVEQLKNPYFYANPNYWVSERKILKKTNKNSKRHWFLGFRDIADASMERTLIPSIMPFSAIGNTVPIFNSKKQSSELLLFYANLASFTLDFISRIKISRVHMSFYIVEQLPVFPPERYNQKLKKEITSRVMKLVYTAHDLDDFAEDQGYNKKPFIWNTEERMILKSEIDAIYALLYGISKDELSYIMKTFDNLERKEMEDYGEFKTKRLVLEAYDKYKNKPELFE